jgi:hypothetical protein
LEWKPWLAAAFVLLKRSAGKAFEPWITFCAILTIRSLFFGAPAYLCPQPLQVNKLFFKTHLLTQQNTPKWLK